MADHEEDRPSEPLTRAEKVVLHEAMSGDSVKEIAHRLALSPATVRSHLSSIYGKLNVEGRAQLIARHGADTFMPTGQHPRRRDAIGRGRLVALAAATVVGATLLLASLSVLQPPSVTMAELTELAERGDVSSMRQVGTTLIASTASGEVKVLNASVENTNRLAQAHAIDLDVGSYEPSWLEGPILAIPVAGFAAVAGAAAWVLLRSLDRRNHRRSPSE